MLQKQCLIVIICWSITTTTFTITVIVFIVDLLVLLSILLKLLQAFVNWRKIFNEYF